MKNVFLFYTRKVSTKVVIPCIVILGLSLSASLKGSTLAEDIIDKVGIIMTQPTVEQHKSLGDFVDEIIILVNQDPQSVNQWLSKYNLTIDEFVNALDEAKNAKNVLQVQKAFKKFWPAVPENIKKVGLIKMALNVNTRLHK